MRYRESPTTTRDRAVFVNKTPQSVFVVIIRYLYLIGLWTLDKI